MHSVPCMHLSRGNDNEATACSDRCRGCAAYCNACAPLVNAALIMRVGAAFLQMCTTTGIAYRSKSSIKHTHQRHIFCTDCHALNMLGLILDVNQERNYGRMALQASRKGGGP
eukprot:1160928-Pelagomonas_calceolata.AAC.5